MKQKKLFFGIIFIFFLCSPASNLFAYTWEKVYEAKRWGGRAKVIAILGDVIINEESAEEEKKYYNRVSIQTSPKASVILELRDKSVFFFKGNGLYSMELGKKVSTLIVNEQGEFLGMVSKQSNHRYLVAGGNVSFGIKGKALFSHKRFRHDDADIFDPSGNRVNRDINVLDHYCVSTGTADILSKDFKRANKIINARRLKCEYLSLNNDFVYYLKGYNGFFRKQDLRYVFNSIDEGTFDISSVEIDNLLENN